MAERQSKRTERRIRLNLAKRSLSLHEQDLRDIKRQRVKQNRPTTSDFKQVCVRDDRLPNVHFDFDEASGIISEALDGDELKDSIRNEDSSDEFLTSLTDQDENGSSSTEVDEPSELDFNNTSDGERSFPDAVRK